MEIPDYSEGFEEGFAEATRAKDADIAGLVSLLRQARESVYDQKAYIDRAALLKRIDAALAKHGGQNVAD